jgi:glycosyltransferase involved in cell wall biosynthesis
MLLLCRFFSRKVILEYRHLDRFIDLSSMGWLKRKFLQQFHLILIDSEPLIRKLNNNKIKSAKLLHSVNMDKIKFKLRSKIQPLIIIDLLLNDNFNLNCVFSAYKLVKQKYPRTEILISNSDKDKIEMEYNINIDEYPGIRVSDDELTTILDTCDIYLNCRYYEFMPSSVIEAFMNGLPVVSTPVGMVDKIINRDNILIYNYNDHSALSDLIIKLIENPNITEKLSNNVRKLAQEFNVAKINVYNHSLYNRLLNEN